MTPKKTKAYMSFFKAVFVATFTWLVVFAALRKWCSEGIVFYQGLMVALVTASALYCVRRRIDEVTVFILLTYALNITLITTVDRAYSVKLIKWVADSKSVVTIEQMKEMFQVNFVQSGAIEKRVKEQTASGMFKCDENGCSLTTTGQFINHFFWVVNKLYSLDR